MNQIFLYKENIGALTNRIEADEHKHWMLQLFVSVEKDLEMKINTKTVQGSALVVNLNTPHSFYGKNRTYFTFLINPTSMLGRSILTEKLVNQDYYVLTEYELEKIQETLIEEIDFRKTIVQIEELFTKSKLDFYDKRIEIILKEIHSCNCQLTDHQVKKLSSLVNLSESRLSHLFKEQTQVPLKSYLLLHQLFKAYHLIFDGEKITRAAMDTGFDSAAHLAATSKKMTGMSARKISKDSRFLKVREL